MEYGVFEIIGRQSIIGLDKLFKWFEGGELVDLDLLFLDSDNTLFWDAMSFKKYELIEFPCLNCESILPKLLLLVVEELAFDRIGKSCL
ncbi:hypothetical protein AGMMS49950_04790 [Endomicrobiia bacterium]|nr:hypothetical protein AGMMS49950_04790 [Endomicrobiia bacterium]